MLVVQTLREEPELAVGLCLHGLLERQLENTYTVFLKYGKPLSVCGNPSILIILEAD